MYLVNGVSDLLNVWDGDAVIMFDVKRDVIIVDCKLVRDVKPGDTIIDGELETVDILPAVDSRVVEWCLVTGFCVVFGDNIVNELGLLVEVSIVAVNVIVLCTDKEDEEENLVNTLVQIVLGESEVEISKVVDIAVDILDGVRLDLIHSIIEIEIW